MFETQTNRNETRGRVYAVGEWSSLTALGRTLVDEGDLDFVGHAGVAHDVVLLAVESAAGLARDVAAVRELTKAPIVIVTTSEEPDLLGKAVAARAADLVQIDPERIDDGREKVIFAVRKAMLVPPAGEASRQGRGRLVTVFSPKGGTGKSVTATNLAAYLSEVRAQRTLLLDLDVQFGDVAIMLGLEPVHTLYDVVTAPGELDAEKLAAFTLRDPSGLDVLAAPHRPQEADLVSEEKVSRLLEVALELYDVVVVDTSPYFHGPMLSALDQTDRLLLISGPDIPALKNVRLVLETLSLLSFPTERIRIVLNMVGTRGGITSAEIEAALSLPVHFELPYDPAIPLAVNRGTPGVLSVAGPEFEAAVEAMAEELVPSGHRPASETARSRRSLPEAATRLVARRVRSLR
jgi:pilus assembly protein CpaE